MCSSVSDVVADVDPKVNANTSDFSEISRTIRALCVCGMRLIGIYQICMIEKRKLFAFEIRLNCSVYRMNRYEALVWN